MKWLDQAQFVGVPYGLCLDQKSYDRERRRLKVPTREMPRYAHTATFEKPSGEICCIVTLAPKVGRSIEETYSLLAHEAVHVWQATRDKIGEERPSAEFEAYAIENISRNLFVEYRDQMKARRKKR